MGPQNRCKIAALLIYNVILGLLECCLFSQMNTIWLESIMAAASVTKQGVWIWERAFGMHNCTGHSKFTSTKSDGMHFMEYGYVSWRKGLRK